MTELCWGYTLADIQDIAAYAARTSYGRSSSPTDRLAAAWYGVVEHLFAAEHWPTRDALAHAGRREVTRDYRASWHHYGVNSQNPYESEGSAPKFQRYWYTAGHPAPSPEAAVVDRLTVAQIMPRLMPRHRQVLTALAAHRTHQEAAAALGMNLASYRVTLSRARSRFLELWHEGEQPSRIWRIDRRINGLGEVAGRTSAAALRSQRRGYARTRAAAKAAGAVQ